MIKVTLLVVGVLTLTLAATLDTTEKEGCLSKDEMWPSEDGTKFYMCLPGTNTSIEQSCPANSFFVKNATVSGCVPDTMTDPRCINTLEVEPEPCEGVNVKQPQPSRELTSYFYCIKEGGTPILQSCGDRVFLKQDGYLGCFDWSEWRTITGCTK